jgi:hypothetical protein
MPTTKPEGRKPLTLAQRQALWRQRKAQQVETWRKALEQIRDNTDFIVDARMIARKALEA